MRNNLVSRQEEDQHTDWRLDLGSFHINAPGTTGPQGRRGSNSLPRWHWTGAARKPDEAIADYGGKECSHRAAERIMGRGRSIRVQGYGVFAECGCID